MLKEDRCMAAWWRLQLVLVVIADGFLLCSTQPLRPTEEVVEMVKDTNFFLHYYPWGRRCFECTIEMVKIGRKVDSPTDLVNKLQQESLVLHGYPVIIQLFLVSSVPSLVGLFPHPNNTRPFKARHIKKITKLRCFATANILSSEVDPELKVAQICPINSDYTGFPRTRTLATLINRGHRFSDTDLHGGYACLPKICICNRREKNVSCHFHVGDDAPLVENGTCISSVLPESCVKCNKLEKECFAPEKGSP